MKAIAIALLLGLVTACATSEQQRDSQARTSIINGLPASRAHGVYPSDMYQSGIQGQALLTYSVNDRGSPVRVEVVRSDNRDVSSAAVHVLRTVHFEVPPDWDAQQGPQRRYSILVRYVLFGGPSPKPWDTFPNIAVITIMGTAIRR